jgi:hypothetical protein
MKDTSGCNTEHYQGYPIGPAGHEAFLAAKQENYGCVVSFLREPETSSGAA